MTAKISKIMLWPSRTLNLGDFNSAQLNAGVELSFDKPVALKSKEVKKAFRAKMFKQSFYHHAITAKGIMEPARHQINL